MYKYILLLLLIPLISLSQKSVNPADFEKIIRASPEAQLIDIRNINQYMNGHIKSARLIDFFRDDFKSFFEENFKKNDKLLLYAQSKNATADAGLYIYELGYTDVTILEGGFENWIKSSKPYKSVNSGFSPLKLISKENYVQLLKEKQWTMILFHDDFCEACEKIETTLAELKSEMDNFNYIKINSEINSSLSEWLKIYKSPTVILYKNGIQYWRTTSTPNIETIKTHIY